jgi:very-short-patch-repair endonuclease
MRDDQNLQRARELRKNETMAEKKLWQALRNRSLEGFKFIRQAPIGPFIADFVCREKKLVIELDGWTHSTDEEIAYDARRTSFMEREGYRVVRYDNGYAIEGMDGLLTLILEELKK